MMDKKSWWVFLSIFLACSEAAKLLVIFPLPGKSHSILGDGIVRHLLNAGHEVTYVTTHPYKNPPPNLRTVDVSSNFELIPEGLLTIKNIMENKVDLGDHSLMIYLMTEVNRKTAENPNFQKILVDPNEQFDAVITEWLYSDLPAGFAAIFNCPQIWSSSMEPHWMILDLVDQPLNPAYNPDFVSPYSPPLSFLQRVNELWIQLKVRFLNYVFLDSILLKAYNEVMVPIILKRGRQPPAFHEIRYNASLVLGNSYVSMGYPVSLPQNYKSIGGYHIEENLKPLPEDLKKIMDNAKHGVIFFSMGSNLKSKDLPDEIKSSLLKMFGTLKQTVLWKFEEVLPDMPANVHILTWAPQPAILAHPNCAIFITHGGLLSTTEAIHYGVPVIGIPVFGDQFMNVLKSVEKGFAKRVDLSYTMVDELKEAIVEMTTNRRYTEKAKELSFIHHDRPTKPAAELVHWVQHVVNTRGAPHLRSPAYYTPFYQKLYLDVAVVMATILFAVIYLIKRVVRNRKKTASQKKNN